MLTLIVLMWCMFGANWPFPTVFEISQETRKKFAAVVLPKETYTGMYQVMDIVKRYFSDECVDTRSHLKCCKLDAGRTVIILIYIFSNPAWTIAFHQIMLQIHPVSCVN